ncbi:MAG TPA: hypothetical protein VMB51_01065 [Solirubrobacteraceae bacterium]|nr:hypothetical protein [Solirubrobacteraceae bacterium]
MSASAPTAPSARQLRYLRALAARTGTTFAYPRSRAAASREIDRLRKLTPEPRTPASQADDETPTRYAPAVDDRELCGYGSSARWRDVAAPPARRAAHRKPNKAKIGLGAYTTPGGQERQLLAVTRPDESVLVLDCPRKDGLNDARLLARLAPDEPFENARLVCEMYLADERKGSCRHLSADDLRPPQRLSPLMSVSEFVSQHTRLLDSRGRLYAIRVVNGGEQPQLRWTRCATPGASEEFVTLSLREVIAALEDYEPARAITARALAADRDGEPISSACLREESRRLAVSPIILNRRLREVVEARVAAGLSMSQIALRCGRTKQNSHGALSGETSWLARRIGQLPDSGQAQPTPWIHTDTLALIARDGLGLSPHEVEV